jgi:hypothetical protein
MRLQSAESTGRHCTFGVPGEYMFGLALGTRIWLASASIASLSQDAPATRPSTFANLAWLVLRGVNGWTVGGAGE